jgi:trimethylamine--corrinoid protein Co-methyltransferase
VYAHVTPREPEREAGLARALARHHAGVLAACLLVQEAAPGAPFIYTVPPVEGLVVGAAEEPALFALAALQLASHVRLPVCSASLATRAVEAGWRACTDNALAVLSAAAAGGPLLIGAGTLVGGTVFSSQALVMDAELFSWNARIADGIAIDAERLAVPEIEQVGIGGNYLGRRHTRTHAREVWRPRILDRSPWDAWEASGRLGATEKADALARDYLSSFTPAPLGRAEQENLSRIVAESGL